MTSTESLRQRTTFKSSEDSPNKVLDENRILDEQEQEKLIGSLRDQNAKLNQKLLLLLRVILAVSGLLHMTSLFVPSRDSPLLAIFPRTHPDPLAVLFTLLALLIHVNLAVLLYAEHLRGDNIRLIPYPILFGLSAVAPTLCVLLGRPWQDTIWWSLAGMVILVVHRVQRSIVLSNTPLVELEKLMYVARSA